LASKGITRSGEAYCLSCHQMVEREATKCEGCLSELTEQVKAFPCPKCQTIIALGEPQCPTCGLRFKVKTVKARETGEDDRFLMKLIEWGKAPPGEPQEAGKTKAEEEKTTAATPSPPEGQLIKLAQLKESVKDLMANRSEMLDRMEKRLAEEKGRLASISAMDDKTASPEQVEAEIMALADEMADITMLQAHMESLSDEISSLMESVDVSEATKERGLAAKALRKKLDAKEKEVEELKAKEDQLSKREEMVDRKIQAYAAKKKQLDETETELQAKLTKLEDERAELERLKANATGARTEGEREEAREEWLEEQKKLRQQLTVIKSTVAKHRLGREPTEEEIQTAEGGLDDMIAELEKQIGELIVEKVDLQSKTQEASLMDEDLKRLLKVMDQMLGQLPEDAIERFSKSDEFALYERILDRFKI
jgi:DNA repair exonuclease SbcCD ATPase subunit